MSGELAIVFLYLWFIELGIVFPHGYYRPVLTLTCHAMEWGDRIALKRTRSRRAPRRALDCAWLFSPPHIDSFSKHTFTFPTTMLMVRLMVRPDLSILDEPSSTCRPLLLTLCFFRIFFVLKDPSVSVAVMVRMVCPFYLSFIIHIIHIIHMSVL